MIRALRYNKTYFQLISLLSLKIEFYWYIGCCSKILKINSPLH